MSAFDEFLNWLKRTNVGQVDAAFEADPVMQQQNAPNLFKNFGVGGSDLDTAWLDEDAYSNQQLDDILKYMYRPDVDEDGRRNLNATETAALALRDLGMQGVGAWNDFAGVRKNGDGSWDAATTWNLQDLNGDDKLDAWETIQGILSTENKGKAAWETAKALPGMMLQGWAEAPGYGVAALTGSEFMRDDRGYVRDADGNYVFDENEPTKQIVDADGNVIYSEFAPKYDGKIRDDDIGLGGRAGAAFYAGTSVLPAGFGSVGAKIAGKVAAPGVAKAFGALDNVATKTAKGAKGGLGIAKAMGARGVEQTFEEGIEEGLQEMALNIYNDRDLMDNVASSAIIGGMAGGIVGTGRGGVGGAKSTIEYQRSQHMKNNIASEDQLDVESKDTTSLEFVDPSEREGGERGIYNSLMDTKLAEVAAVDKDAARTDGKRRGEGISGAKAIKSETMGNFQRPSIFNLIQWMNADTINGEPATNDKNGRRHDFYKEIGVNVDEIAELDSLYDAAMKSGDAIDFVRFGARINEVIKATRKATGSPYAVLSMRQPDQQAHGPYASIIDEFNLTLPGVTEMSAVLQKMQGGDFDGDIQYTGYGKGTFKYGDNRFATDFLVARKPNVNPKNKRGKNGSAFMLDYDTDISWSEAGFNVTDFLNCLFSEMDSNGDFVYNKAANDDFVDFVCDEMGISLSSEQNAKLKSIMKDFFDDMVNGIKKKVPVPVDVKDGEMKISDDVYKITDLAISYSLDRLGKSIMHAKNPDGRNMFTNEFRGFYVSRVIKYMSDYKSKGGQLHAWLSVAQDSASILDRLENVVEEARECIMSARTANSDEQVVVNGEMPGSTPLEAIINISPNVLENSSNVIVGMTNEIFRFFGGPIFAAQDKSKVYDKLDEQSRARVTDMFREICAAAMNMEDTGVDPIASFKAVFCQKVMEELHFNESSPMLGFGFGQESTSDKIQNFINVYNSFSEIQNSWIDATETAFTEKVKSSFRMTKIDIEGDFDINNEDHLRAFANAWVNLFGNEPMALLFEQRDLGPEGFMSPIEASIVSMGASTKVSTIGSSEEVVRLHTAVMNAAERSVTSSSRILDNFINDMCGGNGFVTRISKWVDYNKRKSTSENVAYTVDLDEDIITDMFALGNALCKLIGSARVKEMTGGDIRKILSNKNFHEVLDARTDSERARAFKSFIANMCFNADNAVIDSTISSVINEIEAHREDLERIESAERIMEMLIERTSVSNGNVVYEIPSRYSASILEKIGSIKEKLISGKSITDDDISELKDIMNNLSTYEAVMTSTFGNIRMEDVESGIGNGILGLFGGTGISQNLDYRYLMILGRSDFPTNAGYGSKVAASKAYLTTSAIQLASSNRSKIRAARQDQKFILGRDIEARIVDIFTNRKPSININMFSNQVIFAGSTFNVRKEKARSGNALSSAIGAMLSDGSSLRGIMDRNQGSYNNGMTDTEFWSSPMLVLKVLADPGFSVQVEFVTEGTVAEVNRAFIFEKIAGIKEYDGSNSQWLDLFERIPALVDYLDPIEIVPTENAGEHGAKIVSMEKDPNRSIQDMCRATDANKSNASSPIESAIGYTVPRILNSPRMMSIIGSRAGKSLDQIMTNREITARTSAGITSVLSDIIDIAHSVATSLDKAKYDVKTKSGRDLKQAYDMFEDRLDMELDKRRLDYKLSVVDHVLIMMNSDAATNAAIRGTDGFGASSSTVYGSESDADTAVSNAVGSAINFIQSLKDFYRGELADIKSSLNDTIEEKSALDSSPALDLYVPLKNGNLDADAIIAWISDDLDINLDEDLLTILSGKNPRTGKTLGRITRRGKEIVTADDIRPKVEEWILGKIIEKYTYFSSERMTEIGVDFNSAIDGDIDAMKSFLMDIYKDEESDVFFGGLRGVIADRSNYEWFNRDAIAYRNLMYDSQMSASSEAKVGIVGATAYDEAIMSAVVNHEFPSSNVEITDEASIDAFISEARGMANRNASIAPRIRLSEDLVSLIRRFESDNAKAVKDPVNFEEDDTIAATPDNIRTLEARLKYFSQNGDLLNFISDEEFSASITMPGKYIVDKSSARIFRVSAVESLVIKLKKKVSDITASTVVFGPKVDDVDVVVSKSETMEYLSQRFVRELDRYIENVKEAVRKNSLSNDEHKLVDWDSDFEYGMRILTNFVRVTMVDGAKFFATSSDVASGKIINPKDGSVLEPKDIKSINIQTRSCKFISDMIIRDAMKFRTENEFMFERDSDGNLSGSYRDVNWFVEQYMTNTAFTFNGHTYGCGAHGGEISSDAVRKSAMQSISSINRSGSPAVTPVQNFAKFSDYFAASKDRSSYSINKATMMNLWSEYSPDESSRRMPSSPSNKSKKVDFTKGSFNQMIGRDENTAFFSGQDVEIFVDDSTHIHIDQFKTVLRNASRAGANVVIIYRGEGVSKNDGASINNALKTKFIPTISTKDAELGNLFNMCYFINSKEMGGLVFKMPNMKNFGHRMKRPSVKKVSDPSRYFNITAYVDGRHGLAGDSEKLVTEDSRRPKYTPELKRFDISKIVDVKKGVGVESTRIVDPVRDAEVIQRLRDAINSRIEGGEEFRLGETFKVDGHDVRVTLQAESRNVSDFVNKRTDSFIRFLDRQSTPERLMLNEVIGMIEVKKTDGSVQYVAIVNDFNHVILDAWLNKVETSGNEFGQSFTYEAIYADPLSDGLLGSTKIGNNLGRKAFSKFVSGLTAKFGNGKSKLGAQDIGMISDLESQFADMNDGFQGSSWAERKKISLFNGFKFISRYSILNSIGINSNAVENIRVSANRAGISETEIRAWVSSLNENIHDAPLNDHEIFLWKQLMLQKVPFKMKNIPANVMNTLKDIVNSCVQRGVHPSVVLSSIEGDMRIANFGYILADVSYSDISNFIEWACKNANDDGVVLVENPITDYIDRNLRPTSNLDVNGGGYNLSPESGDVRILFEDSFSLEDSNEDVMSPSSSLNDFYPISLAERHNFKDGRNSTRSWDAVSIMNDRLNMGITSSEDEDVSDAPKGFDALDEEAKNSYISDMYSKKIATETGRRIHSIGEQIGLSRAERTKDEIESWFSQRFYVYSGRNTVATDGNETDNEILSFSEIEEDKNRILSGHRKQAGKNLTNDQYLRIIAELIGWYKAGDSNTPIPNNLYQIGVQRLESLISTGKLPARGRTELTSNGNSHFSYSVLSNQSIVALAAVCDIDADSIKSQSITNIGKDSFTSAANEANLHKQFYKTWLYYKMDLDPIGYDTQEVYGFPFFDHVMPALDAFYDMVYDANSDSEQFRQIRQTVREKNKEMLAAFRSEEGKYQEKTSRRGKKYVEKKFNKNPKVNHALETSTTLAKAQALASPGVFAINLIGKVEGLTQINALLFMSDHVKHGPFRPFEQIEEWQDLSKDVVSKIVEDPESKSVMAALMLSLMNGDFDFLMSEVAKSKEAGGRFSFEGYIDNIAKNKGFIENTFAKIARFMCATDFFRGWMIKTFLKVLPRILKANKREDLLTAVTLQDGSKITALEARLNQEYEENGGSGMMMMLFNGNDDLMILNESLQAFNIVNTAELMHQNAATEIAETLGKNHTGLKFLTNTLLAKFVRASINYSGKAINPVFPTSTANYLMTEWIMGDSESAAKTRSILGLNAADGSIDPSFKAKHDILKVWPDLKSAFRYDITIMGVTHVSMMLASCAAFDIPRDEDGEPDYKKMCNYDEYTLFGQKIGMQWWDNDTLGIVLPIACFWKSVQSGHPCPQVLFKGLGQQMSCNPFMRAADVFQFVIDPENTIEDWNETCMRYENAPEGAPSFLTYLETKGGGAAATWASQFFLPAFAKEVYQASGRYENSYNLQFEESASGRETEAGEYGQTQKVSYVEAQKRRLARNNPFCAIAFDLASGISPFEQNENGYASWQMPYTPYYDVDEQRFRSLYTIKNEDGSLKSAEEMEGVATYIIGMVMSTDENDLWSLVEETGFSLDYETRKYCSQIIAAEIKMIKAQWSQGQANGTLDPKVIGWDTYYELRDEKDRTLEIWQSTYDKLWSTELNRKPQTYRRVRTTYEQDINGDWYATGFDKNLAGWWFPFLTGPTVENAGPEHDYATISAVTGKPMYDDNGNGMRALVPNKVERYEKPSIDEVLEDVDSDLLDSIGNIVGGSFGSSTVSYGGGYGGGGSDYVSPVRPSVTRIGTGGNGGGYSSSTLPRTPGIDTTTYRSPNTSYLRPSFETRGSSKAYKREEL